MKRIVPLAALATGLLSGALAQEPATLKLVKTIPLPGVKGRFDHFAEDAKDGRLFVAALGNNTLEVVDPAAGKRIQSVPGMSKPTGVFYLPYWNQVCVANGDDGTLKIMDGAKFKVLKNLTDLNDADNLRFDDRTVFAWLGYADGALGVVDLVTLKQIATVKLAKHPESFQLEQNGNRIFVNVPDAKQVAVVDRKKRAVIATWPMEKFQANFPMALDEANHRLFVGCRQPPRLVVFDTATGKSVADLAISGDTDDLFYDTKHKRLYASCGEGFIDVVEQRDTDNYKLLEKTPTAAGARTSFFSRESNQLYLAVPQRANQPAEIRIYQITE